MSNKFQYKKIDLKNKILRSIWNMVWILLYRPSPKLLHKWRVFLLRMFGANLGKSAYIYPSAKVWAPWNLTMGDYSTLADGVDCYCVDKVNIGSFTTISQYSYLCTASHDYLDAGIIKNPQMPLIGAPIVIGSYVWITSGVFIGPGIIVEEGAVILARSVVLKNVKKWTVVAGNPARFIKNRILQNH